MLQQAASLQCRWDRHLPCGTDLLPDVLQTKTYYIFEEDGEPILHRAEGTEIQWKTGKNPTVKVRAIAFALCPVIRLSVLQLIRIRIVHASDLFPLVRHMKL